MFAPKSANVWMYWSGFTIIKWASIVFFACLEIAGGVTDKNANALIEAGANVLVAGSYVFGAENPTETIEDLKNLIG